MKIKQKERFATNQLLLNCRFHYLSKTLTTIFFLLRLTVVERMMHSGFATDEFLWEKSSSLKPLFLFWQRECSTAGDGGSFIKFSATTTIIFFSTSIFLLFQELIFLCHKILLNKWANRDFLMLTYYMSCIDFILYKSIRNLVINDYLKL